MSEEIVDPTDVLVLKRALKAYRKKLKATRLDDESHLRHGALTKGTSSGVVGIRPPVRFPQPVWDELVKQGRLVKVDSLYELPQL
jgi:hypothetical protein